MTPRAPRLDPRRAAQFAAELRERAAAWLPSWDLTEGEGDFGRALLDIAARFSSEVTERFDHAGEKMRRGFLDWLAVRGEAARPARMPVAFKLVDAAPGPVLASAPVRLQADANGIAVVFETETDVRVVPGQIAMLVAADADRDELFVSPPGLSDLKPVEPLPAEWQLQSFASIGATRLQLDPELGLAPGMVVAAGAQQYRIIEADKDLVTIEPPLAGELPAGSRVEKVSTFAPFGGTARNWQTHAVYLGDAELLNIDAPATLVVEGATALRGGITWQYWGKRDDEDAVGWQPLTPAADSEQPDNGELALAKPKGAVEPREIGGRSSRWIRAFTQTLGPATDPFTIDEFRIRLNVAGCDGAKCPPDTPTTPPAAEGMANTTPLVLENVFFPLGKDPKQFDAFYLGSQEAFSKKNAQVQLCFEVADPTFLALAAAHEGVFANQVLAGVARDRALHLLAIDSTTGGITKFRKRDALRPPLPALDGAPASGGPVVLDEPQPWRLPVWSPDQGFVVAASAGGEIWLWREKPADNEADQSGWSSFGTIPVSAAAEPPPISGLVNLTDGTKSQLVVLRDHQMAVRQWPDGAQWTPVPTKDAVTNTSIELEALVPILVETAIGLVTSATEGMIGVSAGNRLYTVTLDGLCTALTSDIDSAVRPVAVRELASGELLVAAVADSLTDLVMFHSALGDVTMALDGVTPKVVGLEVVRDTHTGASVFHFLASVKTAGDSYVTAWTPHEAAGDEIQLFSTRVPTGFGAVNGIPVAASPYIVVPGTRGAALVAAFDPSLRETFEEALATAVITSPTTDQLVIDDWLAIPFDDGGVPNYRLEQVTVAGVEHGGETLHAFDGETIDFPMFVYRAATAASQGTVDLTALDTLLIDANDPEPNFGDVLLIETDVSTNLYAVVDFDPVTHVVTLDPSLDSTDDTVPVDYWRSETTEARLRPLLRLTPATTGNWAAEILDRTSLVFPGADPTLQSGTAFETDNAGHPELVVLGAHWTTHPPELPGPVVEFIVDGAMGAWRPQLVDSSSNPELSWEYWNGKGWWRLDVTTDLTRNLKTTGAVRFKVPADLASSDWAGRTNHWIRARLIGGDYGREKVTVTSKPLPAGASEQTIERSSEGIRAPSVLKLHISYAICEGVRPMFVLAEDSGSVRDQSDANRTAGAVVEAFVPLDVMLGRLANSPVGVADAAAACPPECGCGGGMTGGQSATASATVPGTSSRRFSGRALFIGVDAVLSEAPVNVLLLVDEHDLSAFAPMTVEALVADRFVPVVANDSTRALGESGVLSMAFAVPPTRRELFGSALTWLRLTPATQAATTGNWTPAVRGAYLNAAWASATETLTRELLGSSDGAPILRFTLARPPVLHNTLELRVKEPLSDEERAELRAGSPHRVLTEVEGLPGDWVLWDQVIDPGDEGPGARVYAFDEGSGEVRFGDGLHGMIPPIGRESIVAFAYKRTEPGPAGSDTVPANGIAARTALNLVSPVESVEAVFAADRAAGGAPPEPDDRVLRFGFARVRHRNRAVTLQDLEDLALQSSPDIVQAHAVRRRDSIHLVVVMRGEHPSPTAPQVRELRRLLLARSPVALSARDALRIAGPHVRRLRIELVLRVETLDVAGAVGAEVKQRLVRFFDTATGSVDGGGWRLGANPSDEDIAFALIDLPHLDSILSVSLREVADDGAERPWAGSINPAELALLDEDPIRLRFETAEVLA